MDCEPKTIHPFCSPLHFEKEKTSFIQLLCNNGRCNWKLLLIVFIITAVVICIFSSVLKYNNIDDPLSRQIISGCPTVRLDGWRISHFIFYAFLGWFFPHCWKFALIISVVWELIEAAAGYFNEDGSNFWQGNVTDIITNMLGFFIGRGLRVSYCDCV